MRESPPESERVPAASDPPMAATYGRVLIVWVIVLAALFAFSRYFS
jgi:hypothetical protein